MMIAGIVALIGLLSATVAADQTTLSAEKCLSSSSGARGTGYQACCPSASSSGKETIAGVQFRYTCATWAKPVDGGGLKADSARDCANLCAKNSKCSAASWFSAKGMCYLTTVGSYELYKPSPGSLLIEKMDKTEEPEETPDCNKEIANAKSQCKSDKESQYRALTEQCEMEKNALSNASQTQNNRAEEQCKRDKASLEQERSQSLKEKDEIRQKAIDDVRQCDAAKSALDQQLRQCREDKDRADSMETQAKAPIGACQIAGWNEMCSSSKCPEIFTVSGVEYKKSCNTATFHTTQALKLYNTPWECLEKECSHNSNCIGIGWVVGIARCHVHYRHPILTKYLVSHPTHQAIFKHNAAS